MSDEALAAHFAAIAEASPVPVLIYQVPLRLSTLEFSMGLIGKLSEHPNIVGIKDATNDLDRGRDLIARCPNDFAIYSGEDGSACQLMLAGGKGTISVTANAAPNLMHRMCKAAVDGDVAVATALDEQLSALHVAMFLESNPIPAKWAVQQLGLADAGIRLPLLPLSSGHHDTVRTAMQVAGVL